MTARRQRSVRFGAVTTTIIEDDSHSSSSSCQEERWVPEARLQKLWAKELFSAEKEYALTKKINLDWRGLEYHFSTNAKRPKFAKLYVKAVVQKSLALRSAAFLLGKNKNRGGVSNIEQSLQRYASQHARATAMIAREVGKHDEQEARRLDDNSSSCSVQETSSPSLSPRTPSRTTRTRRSLIPQAGASRKGTSMVVIPV